MHYDIALIPGDGVGPEVTSEAVKVLEAAASKYGFGIKTTEFDWGCDYCLKHGEMMPPDLLDTLKAFSAVFAGSVGDASKVPDHISIELILAIRKGFEQYVNLRPIFLYPGVSTPLRTCTPGTVDMVVIRENTEGEYSQVGGFFKEDSPDGFALQTAVFTRKGCERVMRYSFELAQKRKAAGKPGRLTNCTKSNALNYSMVFWDKVFAQVAADYPDVETNAALVDALTMWFVKDPSAFDVVVASNLFGDIITDLGSTFQGGMGFAGGGNINPEKEYPSLFEPIHGSAPKYTGKQIVNPVASIEAIRMMLEHIDEKQAAEGIKAAVAKVLAEGRVKTRDMGGSHKTHEMGDAIKDALLAG